jgi:organic radical activating enzyme
LKAGAVNVRLAGCAKMAIMNILRKNRGKCRKKGARIMDKYQVSEIFYSLQGEGFNTGRPVTFVRLFGCNLNCAWCDSRFNEYEELSAAEIVAQVQDFGVKSVIITGGEPTRHDNLLSLARLFKEQGYWVGLETNGVNGLSEEAETLFDYIAVSPKAAQRILYENGAAAGFADEVRVVVDGEVFDFCEFIEDRIEAQHYYLSPVCHLDETFNVMQTIQTLGKLNMRKSAKKWGLSFQTHKMANIQ